MQRRPACRLHFRSRAHHPAHERTAQQRFRRYPANYQAIIKRRLAETLVDPDSAKIDGFTPPRKYLRVYQDFKTQRLTYYPSYAVCVRINSKNRYGGYTGWQNHVYFIRNGEIMLGGDPLHIQCDSRQDFFLYVEPLANIEVKP